MQIVILSANNHNVDPSFNILTPFTTFPHLIPFIRTARKMLNSSRNRETLSFYKQRNKDLGLSKVIQRIRAEPRLDSKVYKF
jgi:hypothetical protein